MKIIKLLLVAASLTAAAQLQAAIVWSDFGGSLSSGAALGEVTYAAVGFNTTAGFSSVNLQNIVFDGTLNSGSMFVQIRQDSSGSPGSAYGTVFNVTGGPSQWTAAPATTFALNPSTTYWVTISTTGTSSTGHWNYNTSSYTSDYGSLVTGAGQKTSPDGTVWNTTFFNPSLQVNSVPEPHEYAMVLALGLIGFAAIRRKLAA